MTIARRFPQLRLLIGLARPHSRALLFGLLLALLGSATGLATPMVTKWVLDSIAAQASMAAPVIVLLMLLVAGSAAGFFQWTLLGATAERIVLEVRESMFRRFLRATVGSLATRSIGELVTRVTSDTVLLRAATSSSAVGILNGLVMLIGTLVLMGVLDLVLLGTTLAAVAVVVVLFIRLMPSIATSKEQAQEAVGRLGGILEGAIRAIKTIKVSRAEARQGERLSREARESAQHSIRSIRHEGLAWTIAFSGIQIAIIVILCVGAWRVALGQLEVSSFIAFLLYSFGLMGPILELSTSISSLQSGVAAASRLRELELLEIEPVATSTSRREPSPVGHGRSDDQPLLELRRVTAGYGANSAPAVRDITLNIPRRGHIAIVGPSGAGKTTLFSLLLNFIRPDAGELLLDGRPYSALTHDEIRARFAYVEQDTPVIPGTIGDNLLFTHPDATPDEVDAALRKVLLAERIRALPAGLDTNLNATTVSGGERQRIALARAILRTPDILLLDEATAQVDGITEAAIHECIREQAQQATVITIAHRLSTVVDADRIVVLEAGRIRDQGTHAELLARDALYRDLIEALRIARPA
jgi:ABC-type multidrug transport system fused ATPase/permease subunit